MNDLNKTIDSFYIKRVKPRSMVDALLKVYSSFMKGGNSAFIAAIVSGLFPKNEYRSFE